VELGVFCCRTPTHAQHIYLHWIMSISQIITGVEILVFVLCLMSLFMLCLIDSEWVMQCHVTPRKWKWRNEKGRVVEKLELTKRVWGRWREGQTVWDQVRAVVPLISIRDYLLCTDTVLYFLERSLSLPLSNNINYFAMHSIRIISCMVSSWLIWSHSNHHYHIHHLF
jgi:hypothetical protein